MRCVPPGLVKAGVLIACLWLAHPRPATAASASAADPAGVTFDGKAYTNRLIHSRNPYLLQHAHNPVNWYPWGSEALEAARRENKPIFVSFGYSTCYWCHVAEREIYSNPEIAKLMNQWFINIKVDREERPDIDRIYMLATQTLTGRGGWPNNVFLTPDLKPFYAGSYFPPQDREGRPGFKRVLETMHRAWGNDRAKVLASADRVYQALQQAARGIEASGFPPPAPRQWLAAALVEADRRYDDFDGGFSGGGVTKFPQSPLLSMLLAASAPDARTDTGKGQPEAKARRMATATLAAMAEGGVMDQLAGGFHRYSTEPSWSVPHFEKMLYDNAQLLSLYAHAYAITREPLFRQVALRTAHYLTTEMRAPEGGFYSAQDAEVNGIEGVSYLWTRRQIETVLGKSDAGRFMKSYSLTPMPEGFAGHPQAEGGVLRVRGAGKLAGGSRLAPALDALRPLREKLLAARAKRPQPARDEKIVTATNALAIIGFADAGRWLNDPALTRTALGTATWIWRHGFDPTSGELAHQFFAGHPGNGGFLDDYALLGRAFLTLHRQTGDEVWASRARQIAEAMLKRFDRGTGRLAETPNWSDLLVEPPVEGDSVLPSGQSSAVGLLLELSVVTGDSRYAAVARRVLSSLAGQIASQPSSWGALLAPLARPPLVAALEKAPQARLAQTPLPDSADRIRAQAHLATTTTGADLTVTIVVEPGYHINANPASDASLIPTQLTLAGYPDIKVDYPAAQRFKAPFAPQGIAVYHGRITLLGHLPPPRTGHPSVANLRVQACNDEVCLAPATIAVPIEASPR